MESAGRCGPLAGCRQSTCPVIYYYGRLFLFAYILIRRVHCCSSDDSVLLPPFKSHNLTAWIIIQLNGARELVTFNFRRHIFPQFLSFILILLLSLTDCVFYLLYWFIICKEGADRAADPSTRYLYSGSAISLSSIVIPRFMDCLSFVG